MTVADPATSVPDAPPDDVDAGADESAPTAVLVHGCATSDSGGQLVVHPTREQYVDLLRHLLDDGYVQCLDVFGVDYLLHPGRTTLADGIAPERFEVVLLLMNHNDRTRLRVRVQVPEDDPTLPSLFTLWPGTEAAVVSVAVMMLQEQGALLISDPVGKYLPEFLKTSVAVPKDFHPGFRDPG